MSAKKAVVASDIARNNLAVHACALDLDEKARHVKRSAMNELHIRRHEDSGVGARILPRLVFPTFVHDDDDEETPTYKGTVYVGTFHSLMGIEWKFEKAALDRRVLGFVAR